MNTNVLILLGFAAVAAFAYQHAASNGVAFRILNQRLMQLEANQPKKAA